MLPFIYLEFDKMELRRLQKEAPEPRTARLFCWRKPFDMTNVICTVPGTTAETIVVGVHFDHVSDGDGIVDNWSGAALLPSLLQSLAGSRHRHTFVFVGFTGEEEGLLGSSFYVDHLPEDRLPVAGINIDGFGESDEESFIRDKVCTVTIHSLTPESAHILHRPEDNPAAIKFYDYYDTFHLLAAYIAVLDAQLSADGDVCNVKPVDLFKTPRFRMRRLPAR